MTSPRASRTPVRTGADSSRDRGMMVETATDRRKPDGKRDKSAGKAKREECLTCHAGSARKDSNNGSYGNQ